MSSTCSAAFSTRSTGTSFQLIVRPCDRGDPRFHASMRSFVEQQKLFGAILPPSVSEDQALADILTAAGCPYVRIASVLLDEPRSMIKTHDSEGAAAAARHIATLGHERIAHIRGPSTFRSSHERLRGFEEGPRGIRPEARSEARARRRLHVRVRRRVRAAAARAAARVATDGRVRRQRRDGGRRLSGRAARGLRRAGGSVDRRLRRHADGVADLAAAHDRAAADPRDGQSRGRAC